MSDALSFNTISDRNDYINVKVLNDNENMFDLNSKSMFDFPKSHFDSNSQLKAFSIGSDYDTSSLRYNLSSTEKFCDSNVSSKNTISTKPKFIFATYKADSPAKIEEMIQNNKEKSTYKSRREFIKERNRLAAKKSRSLKVAEVNKYISIIDKLKIQISEKDSLIQQLENEIAFFKRQESIKISNNNSQGFVCNKCLMSVFSLAMISIMVICIVFAVKPYIGRGNNSDMIGKDNIENTDSNSFGNTMINGNNLDNKESQALIPNKPDSTENKEMATIAGDGTNNFDTISSAKFLFIPNILFILIILLFL